MQVPLNPISLEQAGGLVDASIVNQNVNSAENTECLCDHTRPTVLVGDVVDAKRAASANSLATEAPFV